MKKSILLSALLWFLFVTIAYSQVDLKMIMRNPAPSQLSEWVDDPTIIQVIITNTTNTTYYDCTLGIAITNENGEVVAQTQKGSQFLPKFQVDPMPVPTILNGSQVFNLNAMSFNRKLERLAISTNAIPEGDYQICIAVFDKNGKNITRGEEYCHGFTVLIPEPPVLISPVDDDVLPNAFPLFVWTPVVNYNPGRTQIKYKLKVCPVYQGQTPRDAIDRNPVLFEKTDLSNTSYQYLSSDLGFDYFPKVTRFAWMIQALDVNGMPAASNQGRSELATFRTVGDEPQIAIENAFPIHNDTIPWTNPHLVVRFSPYSNEVRSVQLNLTLRDESNTRITHSRTIDFPQGPMLSQQLTDAEKASLLIANLETNKLFPGWMQQLEPGVKYLWSTEATFSMANGSSFTESSVETAFVIGLKKPVLQQPVADTIVKAKSSINIGLSVPQPSKLNLLSGTELDQPLFHGYNAYSIAPVKLVFELAKTNQFDSLIQTKSVQVPQGESFRSGSSCEALFQKITSNFSSVTDTGTYYWRVKYLDAFDSAYYKGAPVRFRIVPDSAYGCFEMLVLQPANDGQWTEGKAPRFSVSVKPELKKSAITGGRIRVWKKTDVSQSNENAMLSKALLDTVFTGNADNKLYMHSTDMSGYTRFDLNFINGDSTSKTFEGDSAAYYVWNFQLKYNKDSIRADKQPCAVDSVVSNNGLFQLLPGTKKSNSCPGKCLADAPTNTTPGTQTLAKDSTLTIGNFKMKLITVSGNPSFLSGTGSVDVPYMRANILVEFNGLKVNSDNQVYEGDAYAKIDEDAPYNKAEGNEYSDQAYNWAADKMKFKQIHEHSSSSGKLVSGFVGSNPVSLPIGYDNEWDGYKFVVGIIGMRFTPTQGTLNAATYVEIPSLGPEAGVGLGAKNICFHKDGFGGKDMIMLYLAQDLGYDSDGSWSFLFKAPTPIDSGTYVMWDCQGMSDFVIAADVGFPRSWMKPAGNNDPSATVKAHFKARSKKYGNSWQWLASATLDDCELAGAEGYKLQVQEMVFDYSDTLNPTGIIFPGVYQGVKTTQWKGFFIRRASVTLPDDLKTFENENPTFAITNVLIDKTGFTGSFIGSSLIQYPKGDFGGWGASIDSIQVDLVSNSLQSGSIKGRLKMSIADSCLIYSGLIARDTVASSSTHKRSVKYQFSIVPKDTLKVDMMKADFNLYQSSKIELYNDEMNKFIASAELSGEVKIEGDAGGLSKLNFKGIKFEGVKVMNKDPYFDKGNWSLASPQHGMAGFPVSINHIEMVTGTRSGSVGAGIRFDLNVGLQEGSNAISGTTKLSIWGKMASGSGPQHFVFDGIDLDSIGIDANLGAVIVKGGLMLYDSHPTFGNGFRGAVSATFVDQIAVQATAQFGSVSDYRYWYVDAKAIMSQGIPVFTGLGIYGFGGGAWYHMRKSGATSLTGDNAPPDSSSTPGITNSGYQFTPDKSVHFGLNASVVLGTHPSPEAFNGDIGLEAQFLSNGGLGTIALVGNGYLLCSIANRSKAKVLANMNLEYNVPTKTFHGVFDVDINANPLDGGGQMTMHFDPDLWYIKIGEPANRINVSLANWIGADGYFMVGQQLPAPQIPQQIVELFPEYTVYRNPLIETGDGFAFGASAGFDTGKQTFLIFYGRVSALMGFDFALLNFGEGTTCEGQSTPIGINGWYAMGQIYAAVSASIGLHVDLWFTSGDFEILGIQAGALLQGAGPNPTWVKGIVGGNYSILSGAVKGHCSFQFSMGDQCRIQMENPLSRLDLISDISPVSGQSNVSVFTEPQVAMNFELDKPFEVKEMPTDGGPAKVRTFRVKLDNFSLRRSVSSDSISGYYNISPDKFSAYYSPHDMLDGNTNHRFAVSAYGEEYLNGKWEVAKKNNGSIIKQQVTTNFRTGAAPDNIVPQNVAYSYPQQGQMYFLQNECRAGRVQLIMGQPNLFQQREGFDLHLIARFIPVDISQAPVEVPFTYNSAARAILFDIPNLMNNKLYYLQLIKKEVCTDPELARILQVAEMMQNGGIQSNFTLYERKVFEAGTSNMFVKERKISADRVRYGEKLLYVLSFKTSNFNTLQAKLSTFNHVGTVSEIFLQNEKHTATYEGAEHFDYYDFKPVKWWSSGAVQQFGPLVKINGSQRTSAWHNSFANPQVYNEINWMKINGFWSGSITFDSYINNPTLHFVEVEYNSRTLSMGEILDAITGNVSGGTTGTNTSTSSGGNSWSVGGFAPSSSVGANLGVLQVGTNPEAPNLKVTYNHGLIVSSDYTKLKNRAISVLSNPFIIKSSTEKNRLNTISNRSYQLMSRGSYPLLYYYNYMGCHGPDDSLPTISKSFIY